MENSGIHSPQSPNALSGSAGATACRYARVFLVDDNPVDLLVSSKIIETQQFSKKTLSFQSAETCLQELRKCAESEWPDLIFLDINMPGMDGFAFLDEFGQFPAPMLQKIKIVMLSTSESFKDLNRANKNPLVRRFLNKPLRAEVLQALQF